VERVLTPRSVLTKPVLEKSLKAMLGACSPCPSDHELTPRSARRRATKSECTRFLIYYAFNRFDVYMLSCFRSDHVDVDNYAMQG
jgi:hypothetical protein